jgi:uncharacterized protein
MSVTNDEIQSRVASGKAYTLVLLLRGEPRDMPEEEARSIQLEHLRHLFTLIQQGKLLINGPLTSDGDLRGISIYDSTDLDEVRRWVNADPAIASGRLRAEIHPWFGLPGSALR